jgi:hypothetical protein
MTQVAAPVAERTLMPIRHADRRRVVLALLGAFAPAYATAILIGGIDKALPLLAATAAAFLAAEAVSWRFAGVRLRLDADGLLEHGLLRAPRRARIGEVASALVVPIYDPHTLQPRRHLFLLDGRARTLFRMREGAWNDSCLTDVLAHFDVPLETCDEPVTLGELRSRHRHQLRWHERHPLRATAVFVLAGAALCVAVALAPTLSLG